MISTYYFILNSLIFAGSQQPLTSKIDAEGLKKFQSEGITIVDIRSSKEYDEGHIPGVSENIDFYINGFVDEFDRFDKSKPIVIHCQGGSRSAEAWRMLQQAGFVKVFDYSGGFIDWVSRGERVEK